MPRAGQDVVYLARSEISRERGHGVIVDGQVLMRHRELLTMDEPEILRQANAGLLRVLDRMRA